jgi:hypothetical protein
MDRGECSGSAWLAHVLSRSMHMRFVSKLRHLCALGEAVPPGFSPIFNQILHQTFEAVHEAGNGLGMPLKGAVF